MNKRKLYRKLHRRMRHIGHLSTVWATFDVPTPFPVPRWSPGPEWVEAAQSYYWIRPQSNGQHEVMVLTYDRNQYVDGWDGDEMPLALVSAVVSPEDAYYATFTDKPHRIYSTGFVEEPLTIEPVGPTHPAVRYNRYQDRCQSDINDRCEEFQPAFSAGSLWVSGDLQIKPDGSGWFLNFHALLGGLIHHSETYWADLVDLSTMLGRIQRHYGSARVYIQGEEHEHFTDPLWQPAMAAIKNAEARS